MYSAFVKALLWGLFAQQAACASIRGLFLFKDVLKSDTVSIKTSGFNSLIIFGVGILEDGSIMYYSNTEGSSDVLIAANGTYVGGSDLSDKVRSFKEGTTTVDRVEISMNAQHVRDLMDSPGPVPESLLYQNFEALKTAWGLDAVNNDDESIYHVDSTVAFAQMLGEIGYAYTIAPYTNSGFWSSVKNQVDTLDIVYLQCYDGGAGNNPATWESTLGMKIVPLLWVINDSKPSQGTTAADAQVKFSNWNSQSALAGGGYWNEYDIERMNLSYTEYGDVLTEVFP